MNFRKDRKFQTVTLKGGEREIATPFLGFFLLNFLRIPFPAIFIEKYVFRYSK